MDWRVTLPDPAIIAIGEQWAVLWKRLYSKRYLKRYPHGGTEVFVVVGLDANPSCFSCFKRMPALGMEDAPTFQVSVGRLFKARCRGIGVLMPLDYLNCGVE